jgi:3-methyladenine DNA glycosylase AlkD
MDGLTRDVVAELRSVADATRKPGMARVGIRVDRALGVAIPDVRRIARGHRGDHDLALGLWATEIHEARILASMIDDPARVTRAQMDLWAADLDSWDVCDQVCMNLFRATRSADAAARAWAGAGGSSCGVRRSASSRPRRCTIMTATTPTSRHGSPGSGERRPTSATR